MSFTKKDLVSGEHVVVCRNGKEYLVAGTKLVGINGRMSLACYNDDLTNNTNLSWDIVGVEEATFVSGFSSGMMNRNRKVVWSRSSFVFKRVEANRRSNALLALEKCVDNNSELFFSSTALSGKPYEDNKHMTTKVTFENVIPLWESCDGNFYYIEEKHL